MLLSSADCIQNDFLKKKISEIPSVSNSLDLNCKGYQMMTVADKQLKELIKS